MKIANLAERQRRSPQVGENKEETVIRVQARQMSNKPNYELRVGLFAVVAVQLVIFGWGWLHGNPFVRQPQRFIVQFHDVAGLNNNAPVNINGVRVGVVEKIELSKAGLVNKLQPNGNRDKDPGLVYVHLKISSEETTIPIGSAITIQTQGMVGAKYIEITLPELPPGQAQPADITSDAVIVGQDPVRIELVMNKIATKLNKIVNAGAEDGGPSLTDVIKDSGEAVKNINEVAKKLNGNMSRFEKASDSITSTAGKIGQVADSAKSVTSGASTFFNRGNKAMDQVNVLAVDFQSTSKKLNKILDNPNMSGDLKETARLAKATADKIGESVDKLNNTIKDPSVRQDAITILKKIESSLDKAQASLATVDKISGDKDVRAVVAKFSDSLGKFNEFLGNADLTGDTKTTFAKLRTAADDVDIAARQMQGVLNKGSFLLGNGGRLDKLKKKDEKQKNTHSSLVDTHGSLVEKVNKPEAEQ
jgi:phospholipid/cholesterol/gamma-HCH transport system substrate-binding protein